MSRAAAWMLLLVTAGAVAASVAVSGGCGFGLADDTGKPVPSDYWKWVCPDGGAPSRDAGCHPPAPADGGATPDGAYPPDAR
ncbi:MAG TPA: hypothetical protein VHM31_22220 [Polyangia bacterium]|nr:hypothetical protein [Polyangia bacterium]